MAVPQRVVIGDDDVLLREGVVRLLTDAGFEVVAQAGDADDLLRKGLAHRPDLLIADINMPPDRTDGIGYLLKERVGDVESFVQAAERVANGRSALDPEVVARVLGRRGRD